MNKEEFVRKVYSDRYVDKFIDKVNLLGTNKKVNPYNLIIGDNEKNNNLVSYRKLGSDETISMKLED